MKNLLNMGQWSRYWRNERVPVPRDAIGYREFEPVIGRILFAPVF